MLAILMLVVDEPGTRGSVDVTTLKLSPERVEVLLDMARRMEPGPSGVRYAPVEVLLASGILGLEQYERWGETESAEGVEG